MSVARRAIAATWPQSPDIHRSSRQPVDARLSSWGIQSATDVSQKAAFGPYRKPRRYGAVTVSLEAPCWGRQGDQVSAMMSVEEAIVLTVMCRASEAQMVRWKARSSPRISPSVTR